MGGCFDTEAQEFRELGPNTGARQVHRSWVYHISASHTANKSVVGIGPKTKEQSDALQSTNMVAAHILKQ
jgi:hypothetical protein